MKLGNRYLCVRHRQASSLELVDRNFRAPVAGLLLLTCFAGLAMLPPTGHAQADDEEGRERQAAKAALEKAIPRAAKDTARPKFHFRAPARWMNDICGAIYHKGYHHIFYQSNPYKDDEGLL